VEEDRAPGEVLDAVARGDRDRLRLLLHPYLRWTTADGRTVTGRTNVLALLDDRPPAAPPRSHELRDGQVYRWVEA
jgi:hypothetical protein